MNDPFMPSTQHGDSAVAEPQGNVQPLCLSDMDGQRCLLQNTTGSGRAVANSRLELDPAFDETAYVESQWHEVTFPQLIGQDTTSQDAMQWEAQQHSAISTEPSHAADKSLHRVIGNDLRSGPYMEQAPLADQPIPPLRSSEAGRGREFIT